MRKTINKWVDSELNRFSKKIELTQFEEGELYQLKVIKVLLKSKYGWSAKYGHWCHVSFIIALDHFIQGGKIRYGRL